MILKLSDLACMTESERNQALGQLVTEAQNRTLDKVRDTLQELEHRYGVGSQDLETAIENGTLELEGEVAVDVAVWRRLLKLAFHHQRPN